MTRTRTTRATDSLLCNFFFKRTVLFRRRDSPIHRWKRSVSARQFDETPRFLWMVVLDCNVIVERFCCSESNFVFFSLSFFFFLSVTMKHRVVSSRTVEFEKFNILVAISRVVLLFVGIARSDCNLFRLSSASTGLPERGALFNVEIVGTKK